MQFEKEQLTNQARKILTEQEIDGNLESPSIRKKKLTD